MIWFSFTVLVERSTVSASDFPILLWCSHSIGQKANAGTLPIADYACSSHAHRNWKDNHKVSEGHWPTFFLLSNHHQTKLCGILKPCILVSVRDQSPTIFFFLEIWAIPIIQYMVALANGLSHFTEDWRSFNSTHLWQFRWIFLEGNCLYSKVLDLWIRSNWRFEWVMTLHCGDSFRSLIMKLRAFIRHSDQAYIIQIK